MSIASNGELHILCPVVKAILLLAHLTLQCIESCKIKEAITN